MARWYELIGERPVQPGCGYPAGFGTRHLSQHRAMGKEAIGLSANLVGSESTTGFLEEREGPVCLLGISVQGQDIEAPFLFALPQSV